MKKRIVSLLVMATLVFSFTGCSSVKTDSTESKTVSKTEKYKAELQKGIDNLGNSDSNYVISNILEAPEGTTYYLENFATSGESFTEYPVDKEGNLGALNAATDEDADNQDYVITDWITADGKIYLNNSKSAKTADYYSLPDSYANICKSRNVMYLDTMINDFTKITKEEDKKEVDLGDSDKVKLTMYKCVLPKDKVENYLAVGSIAMYKSLNNDKNTSDSVKKLCNYYLSDLGETMYFSDANVYLGVDENKVVRTYSLEVGGLGSRLYLTKTVLYGIFQDEKEPDFTNVKSYASSLEELADYLAKSNKDYSTALNELNTIGNKANNLSEEELKSLTNNSSTETSK